MTILQNIGLIVLLVIVVLTLGWVNRSKTITSFLDSKPTPKQNTYRVVLDKTAAVLNKLDIPFFLSSGTCLGYVREHNFINHDYDLDLGIFVKDYTPALIDEMSRAGLYLYRVYGTLQTGMELSFYAPYKPTRRRAKVDIFVHVEDDDKICWFSYNKERTKKLQYCVSKFDLEKVDFFGVKVNIPNPAKKYLEEHYGKDWRIPKSNGIAGEYNYESSPISLVNVEIIDDDFRYEDYNLLQE